MKKLVNIELNVLAHFLGYVEVLPFSCLIIYCRRIHFLSTRHLYTNLLRQAVMK